MSMTARRTTIASTALALALVAPPVAAPAADAKAAARNTGKGSLAGVVRKVRARRPGAPPIVRREYPRRGGQATPPEPPDPAEAQIAPTVPPTAEGTPVAGIAGSRALAQLPGEFNVFRNSVAGTSSTDSLEPSAANDRNAALVTGNFYAGVTGDNGLTFSSLDPQQDEVFGGFCCDQVAYAVDRGGYSLVFWLLQYRYDPGPEQNALRLRLFRGRDDLLDKSDACDWDFTPQGSFKLDDRLWFDFNQVSHTSEFLYVTTNVRKDNGRTPDDPGDDDRIGALIFRIALDDLDDGNCHVNFRYWFRDGDPYISPVQSAGSTMYLATHRSDLLQGDVLRIYSVRDSSTELEKTSRNVDDFTDKSGDCPLPDGTDPCEDQHSGRMSGFRSGSTIGWLWMGDQGGGFPFPHVRAAVFDAASQDKLLETQIWNDEFAWQLPSVGVNEDGHLGVLLYAMGGGRFPKVQGFILTSPIVWAVQMNGVASSDSGPSPDSEGEVSFGHYGSVRPYGDCPETFLGSAYTIEQGVSKGRQIWFGDEGCVDLAATKVTRRSSGPFDAGDTIHATATLQNVGAETAPGSLIGYYLSRDEEFDRDGEIALGAFDTPPLARAATRVVEQDLAAPSLALGGDFHVIACADDPRRIDELAQTNNCAASTGTVTINRTEPGKATLDWSLGDLAIVGSVARLAARRSFIVRETIRVVRGAPTGKPPAVRYSLSRAAGPDDDEVALRSTTLERRTGARSRTVARRLRLPRRVPPGRWYLIGCIRHPPRRGDARAANDCRVVRRLHVGGKASTPGPARPRRAPDR